MGIFLDGYACCCSNFENASEEPLARGGDDDAPEVESPIDEFESMPRFSNPHESVARFENLRRAIRNQYHGMACESEINRNESGTISFEKTSCQSTDTQETVQSAEFNFEVTDRIGPSGKIGIVFETSILAFGGVSIPSVCTLTLVDTASPSTLGIMLRYDKEDSSRENPVVEEDLVCFPKSKDIPESSYNKDEDWANAYLDAMYEVDPADKVEEVIDALED